MRLASVIAMASWAIVEQNHSIHRGGLKHLTQVDHNDPTPRNHSFGSSGTRMTMHNRKMCAKRKVARKIARASRKLNGRRA